MAYDYFSRDLTKKVGQVILNDIEMALESMESRGFILVLALIINSPLTLLKIIDCIWNHFMNAPKNLSDILKNDLIGISSFKSRFKDENSITSALRNIEEAKNTFENKIIKDKNKVDYLSYIRSYLISNKYVLEATLVKKVNHTLEEKDVQDYLNSGELNKPCWTEYVNFSEKMNNALKEVFPHKIKLRKIKESNYPCVVFPNGDTFELIEDLKRLFLNDRIRIKFDTGLNENYNNIRGIKTWN